MAVNVPGSWRYLRVVEPYTADEVEILLPVALWGIEPDQLAPMQDQYKGKHGRPSDLPAILADLQRAWKLTPMMAHERRALFMIALGLTQDEVGQREGFSASTAARRYQAAVAAMVEFLNGGR